MFYEIKTMEVFGRLKVEYNKKSEKTEMEVFIKKKNGSEKTDKISIFRGFIENFSL